MLPSRSNQTRSLSSFRGMLDLKRQRIWSYCKVCPTKPLPITSRVSTFSDVMHSFTRCEPGKRKNNRRSVGVEWWRPFTASILRGRLGSYRRKSAKLKPISDCRRPAGNLAPVNLVDCCLVCTQEPWRSCVTSDPLRTLISRKKAILI